MVVAAHDGLRPAARRERDALFLGFAHFVGMGGHLGSGFQRNQFHVPRAQSQRRPGRIDERVVVAPGLQELLGPAGQRALCSGGRYRNAVRATSIATLPPPMTTTRSPSDTR